MELFFYGLTLGASFTGALWALDIKRRGSSADALAERALLLACVRRVDVALAETFKQIGERRHG